MCNILKCLTIFIYYDIVKTRRIVMKKVLLATVIILSVGLAMVLVGSILQGITWSSGFDGTAFAQALNSIGYIVAMLSGVALTGLGISYAIKGDSKDEKKEEKDEEKKK